jgi:hypothetical protein
LYASKAAGCRGAASAFVTMSGELGFSSTGLFSWRRTASSRCSPPFGVLPVRRPVLLDHMVDVIAKIRSQFGCAAARDSLGATVHCRQGRRLFTMWSSRSFVVWKVATVSCTAHERMNEYDTDERYRQKKGARNQRQRLGDQAILLGVRFQSWRPGGFEGRRRRSCS